MVRLGDIQFEHRRLGRQLAGGALGEGQPTTGTGEDDLRPFLLGQLGHTEGDGCVGEDAGDHDVLAVEETHPAERTRRALDAQETEVP